MFVQSKNLLWQEHPELAYNLDDKNSKDIMKQQCKGVLMDSKNCDQLDKNDRIMNALIKLRHPKKGTGEIFLFDESNANVYQLMNFKETHSSWFIGDSVQSDGGLVFATPMDPIFLVLPYLKQSTKFRPLDQIIMDDEFPGCERLLSCKGLEKIVYISEHKECGELIAYRYDNGKCMNWLTAKVKSLIRVLKSKGVDVSSGARAATFLLNKRKRNADQDDYTKYAYGLLSEYIPEDLSQTLLQHLGIVKDSIATQIMAEPQMKHCKLESVMGPLEDYTLGNDKTKLANKQEPKLTVAQKALSRVDKTGMKSISSFFGKQK